MSSGVASATGGVHGRCSVASFCLRTSLRVSSYWVCTSYTDGNGTCGWGYWMPVAWDEADALSSASSVSASTASNPTRARDPNFGLRLSSSLATVGPRIFVTSATCGRYRPIDFQPIPFLLFASRMFPIYTAFLVLHLTFLSFRPPFRSGALLLLFTTGS